MIGRCVRNTGAALGEPCRGNWHTAKTVFHLEIGRSYIILGMGLFETVLSALVVDETGKPNWLPIGLFDFQDTRLPSDWEFVLVDGLAASGGDASNRWVARWGYSELVHNARHSDELIERDPVALEIVAGELARRRGVGE